MSRILWRTALSEFSANHLAKSSASPWKVDGISTSEISSESLRLCFDLFLEDKRVPYFRYDSWSRLRIWNDSRIVFSRIDVKLSVSWGWIIQNSVNTLIEGISVTCLPLWRATSEAILSLFNSNFFVIIYSLTFLDIKYLICTIFRFMLEFSYEMSGYILEIHLISAVVRLIWSNYCSFLNLKV